ncbi:LysR family transcriptional regulator [Bradyrhizobium sp. 41S5]|uniref:LysR family transcriptional regulator n=1 Tax=Bradyrhizobium sp. 41S5 TaxID=1404443 RepID=UPI00156B26D7|nr:LysR family transcriptional regulator [Bradyrhizobium sp. 41S5]
MSKAAELLHLSQPAISSQIKRLQRYIGGELFVRTANGTSLTELGKLVLQQARRVIDANDQVLRLGGSERPSVCRLGISQLFAEPLFERFGKAGLSDVFVIGEHSSEIRRGLVERFVDVGCLFMHDADGHELENLIVDEFRFETSWVKARDFVARPGAPIPIITLPEDNWIIEPLERMKVAYQVVLRSSDSAVRASAIRAGLGVSAMPSAFVPSGLVVSKDSYLPVLAARRAVVCIREGWTATHVQHLAAGLSELLEDLAGAKIGAISDGTIDVR